MWEVFFLTIWETYKWRPAGNMQRGCIYSHFAFSSFLSFLTIYPFISHPTLFCQPTPSILPHLSQSTSFSVKLPSFPPSSCSFCQPTPISFPISLYLSIYSHFFVPPSFLHKSILPLLLPPPTTPILGIHSYPPLLSSHLPSTHPWYSTTPGNPLSLVFTRTHTPNTNPSPLPTSSPLAFHYPFALNYPDPSHSLLPSQQAGSRLLAWERDGSCRSWNHIVSRATLLHCYWVQSISQATELFMLGLVQLLEYRTATWPSGFPGCWTAKHNTMRGEDLILSYPTISSFLFLKACLLLFPPRSKTTFIYSLFSFPSLPLQQLSP